MNDQSDDRTIVVGIGASAGGLETLSRRSDLPITEVKQDTKVDPNHIYMIPPGQYLSIEGCVLKLSEPQHPRGSRMASDYSLTSLAEDACEFADLFHRVALRVVNRFVCSEMPRHLQTF